MRIKKCTLLFRILIICLLLTQTLLSSGVNNIPIKVKCDNNVCECSRTDNADTLNVNDIIEKIDSGYITDSTLIACCYHQIAIHYDNNFDYLESATYNRLAESIRAVKVDGLLWRTYLNLGYNYYDLNEYKKAVLNLKKSLAEKGQKDSTDSISIYSNIGECYLELGDLETAQRFAEKSLKIEIDDIAKNSARNALASILYYKKDSVNLIYSIKESDIVLQSSQIINDYENIQIALNNLASSYEELGSYQKALFYNSKVIDLAKKDTLYKAALLNNRATILMGLDKSKAAIKAIKQSLNLYISYFNEDFNYDYSACYENFADNYTVLHQFDTALLYYQKSLINLTNNFRNEDIFQNPNPKDTSIFIYSNPDIIRVLHLKATAAYQYYQQNKEEKYLNLAHQTYQTTFNFHDKLQQEISTENSRLFQVKNIVPYIENALKVAYKLQEKGQNIDETAFRFMEKNKATVLLQSINEADALQYANLPDSLLEQEKDIKIAITFNQKQLNETIEDEDTLEIERLDKLLFEEKQQYRQLIGDLEKNHPKYYRLKYQQNQTKLTDVQNQLDGKTALLSYFVGNSSIYTLLILKESTQLFKIQKPANWEDVINNFQGTITLSNPEERFNKYSKKSFVKFVNNAHTLYQYLLQKPLDGLNHIPHLKIIPDAELNYIPFDLLLTNSVDTSSVNYKDLSYLLKQKTISYAYSAALMVEQQQAGTTEKNYAYGGYAPKYNSSNNSDLPKARQLVNNMASFFRGKAYINEEATKANFLKDTLGYQVMHLALHGKLNDQYPLNSHLIFTKNKTDGQKEVIEDQYKLYAADLYLHQLNANLAILNACETGTGEFRKGEGVMSLSRAFTYAGCPSLMMSLWSIEEEASAYVLESFFTNIKKGNLKDAALRQAKLAYLDNTSANFSHPYYWAGLVLTGNTEAMEFKSPLSGLWWVLVLLLILPCGYLLIKPLA